MDNPGYVSLTRQSGLLREMQAVANNIANISTTGFRKEGLIFSEFIVAMDNGDPSLSMAHADVRATSQLQGPLNQTGGSYDLAIEGEGFFLIETPSGQQLTRAGGFAQSPEGELVTPDGYRLLDNGGAPIFVPADAVSISVAADGTISADGRPVAQIGLYRPSDPTDLKHQAGTLFAVQNGVEPVDGSVILQGFVENSNVNAVSEIARMIEIQRAYEMGQKLMDKEDERIRNVLQTLGR